MSLRRRVLIALGILFAAQFPISVFVVRWALTTRACSMPCQDLGLDVEIPSSEPVLSVHKPRCQPLQLKLELHEPKARMNSRYSLWYRVTMRNASCYVIDGIFAHDFRDTAETAAMGASTNWGHGLSIHVQGPDGNKIEPKRYTDRTEFLYYRDEKADQELAKKFGLTDSPIFDLSPGESITTVPSVLRPLNMVERVDWKTGNHGENLVPAPVPPDAEKPPPGGYRILDDRVFTQPGEYTIQAEFDWKISAKPIFPYAKKIPGWLYLGIGTLKFCGMDFYPDDEKRADRKYNVRVKSEKLRFKVDP